MNWEVRTMKSRISFFNKTVFHKDITRYLPVWLIYGIIGLVQAQSSMSGYIEYEGADAAAWYLGTTFSGYAVVNMFYALLTAQLLFGDLFNSKLCNALHALPVSRESWFGSHVLAGIAFSVIPNVLICLSMIPYLEEFWVVALLWLLAMVLEYLFFFGLAVFSALCSGSRFGMVTVYALLNFLSILAIWFINTFYIPLLYGVVLNEKFLTMLSPVVGIFDMELVEFKEIAILMENGTWYDFRYEYQGVTADWWYPAIMAVVGVVLLVVALLLYRKRKLETAGDFIAVRPLAVCFWVVYTLSIGAVFQIFGKNLVFLLVGIPLGFFTGKMLLERTVKVFTKDTFIKLAIFAGVLIGSMVVVFLDPMGMGLVEWTPKAQHVEYVKLNDYEEFGNFYPEQENEKFTRKEDIENLIALHGELVNEPLSVSLTDTLVSTLTGEDAYYNYFRITYGMTDGREVSREYYYDTRSEVANKITKFLSTPTFVLGYTDWETYVAEVTVLEVDGWEIPGEYHRELLEAIKADCEAGTMAQGYGYYDDTKVSYEYYIRIQGEDPDDSVYLDIYSDAVHTIQWIKAHPDLLEYVDYGEYK